MIISLIAALDEAGGIGYNNKLLTHLPADLKYFKTVTMSKPIVMGRHTYESIGKPLAGRMNIIISKQLKTEAGIAVVPNLAEALKLIDSPEVMIIGGGQLYAETIDIADRLYLTTIHHQFPADIFFPNVDLSRWRLKESHFQKQDDANPYDLTFSIYEKQR